MILTRATQISNRQYNMIEVFAANGTRFIMDLESVGSYDQRTISSLAERREAILEKTAGDKGLRLSAYGWAVHSAFHETDIARKHPSLDLSQWLTSYLGIGTKKPRKKTRATSTRIALVRRAGG